MLHPKRKRDDGEPTAAADTAEAVPESEPPAAAPSGRQLKREARELERKTRSERNKQTRKRRLDRIAAERRLAAQRDADAGNSAAILAEVSARQARQRAAAAARATPEAKAKRLLRVPRVGGLRDASESAIAVLPAGHVPSRLAHLARDTAGAAHPVVALQESLHARGLVPAPRREGRRGHVRYTRREVAKY